MKKSLLALLIIAVLGIAAWFILQSNKPKPVAEEAGPQTSIAKKGSVSVVVDGAAIVEPYQQVTLRSSGAALLTSILRSGQHVQQNGVVASLDDSLSRSNRTQAELALSQAELEAQKAKLAAERSRKDAADTKALLESRATSPEKLVLAEENIKNAEIAYDTAEIKVRMAQLVLDKARREVQDALVKAPFSGTVLKTYTEVGDLLSPNTQIALFGDLSRLRLSAEVDEFDIGKIAVGQQVSISGDSIGEEAIRSTVEAISPIAQIVNNISIFTVSAVINNEEGRLRPGMSADFSILIKSDKGLVVPAKSVSSVRGRSYIEVLENGLVEKKRIEIGANDGINLVVLSGIEEGDAVVIPGVAPVGVSSTPAASATAAKSVLPLPIPGSGGVK
ncbi:efflux RND transporter periplasmic adaptor subunit [Treponema sp.]